MIRSRDELLSQALCAVLSHTSWNSSLPAQDPVETWALEALARVLTGDLASAQDILDQYEQAPWDKRSGFKQTPWAKPSAGPKTADIAQKLDKGKLGGIAPKLDKLDLDIEALMKEVKL